MEINEAHCRNSGRDSYPVPRSGPCRRKMLQLLVFFLSLTIPAEYFTGLIFQWGIHQPTIDLTNKQWNIIYKEFIIVTEWEPVAICQFEFMLASIFFAWNRFFWLSSWPTLLAPDELPMAKMFMKRGPLSKKNQVLAVPGGLQSLHRNRFFDLLAIRYGKFRRLYDYRPYITVYFQSFARNCWRLFSCTWMHIISIAPLSCS